MRRGCSMPSRRGHAAGSGRRRRALSRPAPQPEPHAGRAARSGSGERTTVDNYDHHHAGTIHRAGRSHDMSDPAMAASMESDIRTRFWFALALSTLVVLISPMGEMIGIHLPLNAATRSWTLLALTTPVVFWCGWIFLAGAFHSLVSRRLDMSVLLAVGVLVAYLASVYLTIIG